MSQLSRRKIAYDFNVSPYKEVIQYDSHTVKYVFSSELYREKFTDRLAAHRVKINDSLSNRFGININMILLSDIKLYTSIEKRGFLLEVDGVKVPCQKHITLDGNKMTLLS